MSNTVAEMEAEIRKRRHALPDVERTVRIAQDDDERCTCNHSEEDPCQFCRDEHAWFLERQLARRKAERPTVDVPEEPLPF